jgi:pimeloyl-ACP methyl ester carboxylesterase
MRRIVLSAALLACTGTAVLAAAPAQKSIAGTWLGTIEAGGTELRVVFHIKEKKDGFTATLDSPDQGVKGIPIDTVEFKDGKLKLQAKKIKATFEGKANKELTVIKGEWNQVAPVKLTLKRVGKVPGLARPQNPKKPYPYREEEVTFENKKAAVKFAGTLTIPKGKGPFPAVVLLSGSGPQDRDESIMGHKPFLVLADHLTRKGIAVLRTDDRGVGGSSGDTMKSTTADFASDALCAVAFLKGRKEINPKQIGLVGHSEGGVVAPLAASQSRDVAFIVLLAGSAVPGEELLYMQGKAMLKAAGAPPKAITAQREFQELMFKVVKKEKDNEKAKKLIYKRLEEKIAKLSEEEKKQAEAQKGLIEAQLKGMVLTPWFRYFLTLDPGPALRKVRVPVLALNGEKDVQVPPKENLQAIRKALEAGGNKDYTVKELKGLNHLFQTCKTGSLSEYGKIEETFAPAALKEVSDWILKRTKGD